MLLPLPIACSANPCSGRASGWPSNGLVRADRTRRTATPNAVMTTLASPSLGASELSLWLVAMSEGSSGPLHAFDSEQIWTVLDGEASLAVGGVDHVLGTGDTLIVGAEIARQVSAR